MTIEEFIVTRFTPESAPSKRTVLSWIRRGELLAKKIGRKYYIDNTMGDPLLAQSNHSLLTKILEN